MTIPNHVDIVRSGPKEALTALKRIYKAILIWCQELPPQPNVGYHKHLLCKHNVLIVSHGIAHPS